MSLQATRIKNICSLLGVFLRVFEVEEEVEGSPWRYNSHSQNWMYSCEFYFFRTFDNQIRKLMDYFNIIIFDLTWRNQSLSLNSLFFFKGRFRHCLKVQNRSTPKIASRNKETSFREEEERINTQSANGVKKRNLGFIREFCRRIKRLCWIWWVNLDSPTLFCRKYPKNQLSSISIQIIQGSSNCSTIDFWICENFKTNFSNKPHLRDLISGEMKWKKEVSRI